MHCSVQAEIGVHNEIHIIGVHIIVVHIIVVHNEIHIIGVRIIVVHNEIHIIQEPCEALPGQVVAKGNGLALDITVVPWLGCHKTQNGQERNGTEPEVII